MNPRFTIKKISFGILMLVTLTLCIYIFVYEKPSVKNIQNIDVGIQANKKEFTIVAFGDSLTAGFGVDLKDSYPSLLEDILNESVEYKKYNVSFKVINMGVSGESSSGGLDRVDFVLDQKPNLVLIGLGANDMLRSTDPILVRSNIDGIVQKIVLNKVPAILMGVQSAAGNGKEYKKSFDSIYPSVAKKYNLALVPFFLEGVALVPGLNTADGIHPNRVGYEKIINVNILPVLNQVIEKIIKPKT